MFLEFDRDKSGPGGTWVVWSSLQVQADSRDAAQANWCALRLFSCLLVRVRLYPKLLPDVGKLPWVGEAAVGHHLSQRRQASLREEQTGRPNSGIETHQPPLDQALRGCR